MVLPSGSEHLDIKMDIHHTYIMFLKENKFYLIL